MSGINKVILVGHLGKDPEVRHLEGGATVAKFSLATSETYKKQDGTRVENTEWHNIVMWRGLAETAERYLRKGSLIYLEGKIKSRTWDDKEGVKHYSTDIVADTFTMLGPKTSTDNSQSTTVQQDYSRPVTAAEPASIPSEPGDDLPF